MATAAAAADVPLRQRAPGAAPCTSRYHRAGAAGPGVAGVSTEVWPRLPGLAGQARCAAGRWAGAALPRGRAGIAASDPRPSFPGRAGPHSLLPPPPPPSLHASPQRRSRRGGRRSAPQLARRSCALKPGGGSPWQVLLPSGPCSLLLHAQLHPSHARAMASKTPGRALRAEEEGRPGPAAAVAKLEATVGARARAAAACDSSARVLACCSPMHSCSPAITPRTSSHPSPTLQTLAR